MKLDPITEKVLAYDRRNRSGRRTLRYNAVCPMKRVAGEKRPGVQIVTYAVRLDMRNRQVFKEISRFNPSTGAHEIRDVDYHGMGGWVVDWSMNDISGVGIRGDGPRQAEQVAWHSCDLSHWRCGWRFPWEKTVNLEDLKGTIFEWCGYTDQFAIGLSDYLELYVKCPRIELLAKADMRSLISPKIIGRIGDKAFMAYLRAHMDEIKAFWPNIDELVFAYRRKVSLDDARRYFTFSSTCRYNGVNSSAGRKLDYYKVWRYLGRIDETTCHSTVSEYSRYLYHAKSCGYDMTSDGVLFPPAKSHDDFVQRLERIEAEHARQIRREKRKAAAELKRREEIVQKSLAVRLDEIKDFQKSLDRVKRIQASGVTIVLAKTQKELVTEGKRMGNCVGCGTYGSGIVHGSTLILMFNRGGEKFDVEIDRSNWRVRQCYARFNQKAPDDIRSLAEACAAELRKRYNKISSEERFSSLREVERFTA